MPSLNTGGYAKARKRLPEAVLHSLFEQTGQALSQSSRDTERHWLGRHVKVIDGSNVLMADTPANQAAYPQHKNQQTGCGFPIAKLLVAFSLNSAAAIAVRIADYKTSEVALARAWYQTLCIADVVLADRAYGNYLDLVLVQRQQADAVFRMNQSRHRDFRRGKRLGPADHLVTWQRPKQRPSWMDLATFQALPKQRQVREVRFCLYRQGQRTQDVVLVTTLLDARTYPKAKLAELYGLRWQAEVNLDHIKTTLGMETLKAQSPEMVRKELYAHLIAYNLLRHLMEKAASDYSVPPERLSLQGARQSFNHYRPLMALLRTKQIAWQRQLLKMVAHDIVLARPERHEPRVKKQRPKSFPRMMKPRAVLKRKLGAA